MIQSDRSLEDKIAELELKRNPEFRAKVIRLYLEQKWRELGISGGTSAEEKEASADAGNRRHQQDELTRLARQRLIRLLDKG